jgi:YbbR-like protein
VSLITDDWRLKLLAVALAVLMLGAVAFSQNPPRTKSFTVPIHYIPGPEVVLINPPSTTTVTVTGLADAIGSMTPDRIVAVADASKATPGPDTKLNVVATSLVNGVSAQNPPPFAVNVDRLSSDVLTVGVEYQAAAGWQVTKPPEARCPKSPCVVTFSGPASWEVNLKATARFPNPIETSLFDIPNVPITLRQGNTTLDTARLNLTVPPSSLDIGAVDLHAEARTGTTSSSVALVDSAPSHGPPPGYRVTGIQIDPATVVVTGPADRLAQLQSIALPPVDLSSSTSNVTFRVQIPYPNGMSGSVAIAKLTYLISANPNVTPSP